MPDVPDVPDVPAFEELALRYQRVMGPTAPVFVATERYTLRLWDGMDGTWTDCPQAVGVEPARALEAWYHATEGGRRRVTFDEIDYYRIFPAATVMHWGDGREMFR